MKTFKDLILIFTIVLVSCSTKNDLLVKSSNPEITYWGRVDTTQLKGVNLYWSGTSIKLNFEGESIDALLKDESGNNYYNVIIDNDSISLLQPSTTKQYHQLATNLSKGKHTIEIFKRTEWDRGKTIFYGFKIKNEAKLLPKSAPKKRKIEFYGNSITAGYAVEDFSGKDSPEGTFTNNYLSYAAITARYYDAQYQCISRSGIGVTISWFPLTMPEMYNRIIPQDSNSIWDFKLYCPDIVVVNLLQNDSWLVNMPEREAFKNTFGSTPPNDAFIINAYKQFIAKLRGHYPNSSIICMLGNMDATRKDSKWINYIKKAVTHLNDKNIYTHFEPFKGTPGHPSLKEQEQMAYSLIKFIDKNIEW